MYDAKTKRKKVVWLRQRQRMGLYLIFNGKTKHFCKGWMDLIYRTVFGLTCSSTSGKSFPYGESIFTHKSLFSVFYSKFSDVGQNDQASGSVLGFFLFYYVQTFICQIYKPVLCLSHVCWRVQHRKLLPTSFFFFLSKMDVKSREIKCPLSKFCGLKSL